MPLEKKNFKIYIHITHLFKLNLRPTQRLRMRCNFVPIAHEVSTRRMKGRSGGIRTMEFRKNEMQWGWSE